MPNPQCLFYLCARLCNSDITEQHIPELNNLSLNLGLLSFHINSDVLLRGVFVFQATFRFPFKTLVNGYHAHIPSVRLALEITDVMDVVPLDRNASIIKCHQMLKVLS